MVSHPHCLALLLASAIAAAAAPQGLAPVPATPQPAAPHLGAARPFVLYLDGGTLRAEGTRWRADFGAAGARFSTPSKAEPGGEASLQLRLVGARRANVSIPLTDAEPVHAGATDAVDYARGGVVESYRLTATGFAQSFRIDAPPAGAGDLVLTIAAGGNVTAAPAAAANRALEFAHFGVSAIEYGAAVAIDAADRRVPVNTAFDGAGRITLSVPAQFVDAATFPLVVDPTVGAVFQPGGPIENDFNAAVAYDPENGNYLVVWQRVFATSTGIRGARYDDSGNPIGSLWVIADGPNLNHPAVACCNELTNCGFFVVWDDGTRIQGRLLRFNGTPEAPAFAISTPPSGQVDRRPTVSGPGYGNMMVAWERGIANSTVGHTILLRDYNWPSPGFAGIASVGPERTIDTIVGLGNVCCARLARNDVRTTISGTDWFANRLVWQRFNTLGDYDIMTCAVRVEPTSHNFAFLQSPAAVVGGNTGAVQETHADVDAAATLHGNPTDLNYLIVWQDGQDILGHRYNLTGPVMSPITLSATTANEGAPVVGAGFRFFTVGYTKTVGANVDVVARAVQANNGLCGPEYLVYDPGPQFQEAVAVSSRPILPTAGNQRNTTLLAWHAYTGPAGSLSDIHARFFEPLASDVVNIGVACAGPGGTLPSNALGYGGGAPGTNTQVLLSNAPANTLAALAISSGLQVTPIAGTAGCLLFLDLPIIVILPTITDAAGSGFVPLPLPGTIAFGTRLYLQWFVHTPNHNAAGWIGSNGLSLYWQT